MEELKQLRDEIDVIDRQIAALLQQRMDVTRRVGEYKVRSRMKVLDAEREQQVLAAKAALSDDPATQSALTTVFEAIMSVSRKQQRQMVCENDSRFTRYLEARAAARVPLENPHIVYQGVSGAYTEEAAIRFFGESVRRSRRDTWEEIFLALKEGQADYGVLPIENSSTGSINQVYDLLARYGAHIVGEQIVRVEHCLMAPKGARTDRITHVYSHEQGLSQCEQFLGNYPNWERYPMLNTAIAAKYVAAEQDLTKAAIGSRRAAALYDLEILAENISSAENYTRFVIVSPRMELRKDADKISALFTLPHRSGCLHRIMTVFAVAKLNMLKLESRPVTGKNWEYLFFVDFSGNLDQPGMDAVVRELTQSSEDFKVLGNYKGCVE